MQVKNYSNNIQVKQDCFNAKMGAVPLRSLTVIRRFNGGIFFVHSLKK